MDRTRSEDLIKEGLQWLSDKIEYRDNTQEPTKSNSYAVQYSNFQNRVIRRILDFIKQEDGMVILLRTLLDLDLKEDIRDIVMVAVMGKKPIDDFDRYQQLLITKILFKEGSRWA